MITTDKRHVRMLAELCAAYGMKKAVLSPGSRNAPLIMAFNNQPEIECFVIPDERSAGYFALGIAQFTGQPVGLICTSGTAALNYTPALAEAYYQHLPLVAITADRPPEWIDQNDGQTINQTGIYTNFTVFQAQLSIEAYSRHEIWQTERLVRDGFGQLTRKNRPIHFNVPLREPLYMTTDQVKTDVRQALYEKSKSVYHANSDISDALGRYSKIMLVFGMKRPDVLFYKLIEQLAARKNFIIFSENLSNAPAQGVFQTFDALFSAIQQNSIEGVVPELIISFGDMLLSKPLKQWIRSLDGTERWVVTQDEQVPDVFQGIDKVINLDAVSFIQHLLSNESLINTDYYKVWSNVCQGFSKLQLEYIQTVPWSDFVVFKMLSEKVPDNSIVHFGNSSPVRYAQFFSWNKSIQFYGNRGTSGIDGTSSTAVGMASQTNKLVTLITGDVGFLYDSNALWNSYKKKNLRIIVINNKGGNIFSLIGGPENSGLLDDYFTTHIPVSIEYLCKAYGINYYQAKNEQELSATIDGFYLDSACALLEVHTEPSVNTRVWKEYFSTIKNKMNISLRI